MILINSLKDSPVIAMETTMVFFREMMDMPSVREIIRDHLRTIIKLVIITLFDCCYHLIVKSID